MCINGNVECKYDIIILSREFVIFMMCGVYIKCIIDCLKQIKIVTSRLLLCKRLFENTVHLK